MIGGEKGSMKKAEKENTKKRRPLTANHHPNSVSRRESTGATHIGRGGDGNVVKPKADQPDDGDGKELARTKSAGDAVAPQDSADTKKDKESLVSKGKQWLMGKK